MKNFALIGAAGFVAPRHMRAIAETGNHLVAAVDPHDSVGALDRDFPSAQFFTDSSEFWDFVERENRQNTGNGIDYVSICSPNHLHNAQAQQALELGSNVICEKPLAITPQRLDALQSVERASGQRVFTVLQLRLLPSLIALRKRVTEQPQGDKLDVVLTYVTRRGPWYDISWKGDSAKSGGVAMNVGIHLFDLVLWLFGACQRSELHLNRPRRMAGFLELERANVRWMLSLDAADLPAGAVERGDTAYRSLTVGGQELEMTGFANLHTDTYREILAGRGFGIEDALPSVSLVDRLRHSVVKHSTNGLHPALLTQPRS